MWNNRLRAKLLELLLPQFFMKWKSSFLINGTTHVGGKSSYPLSPSNLKARVLQALLLYHKHIPHLCFYYYHHRPR